MAGYDDWLRKRIGGAMNPSNRVVSLPPAPGMAAPALNPIEQLAALLTASGVPAPAPPQQPSPQHLVSSMFGGGGAPPPPPQPTPEHLISGMFGTRGTPPTVASRTQPFQPGPGFLSGATEAGSNRVESLPPQAVEGLVRSAQERAAIRREQGLPPDAPVRYQGGGIGNPFEGVMSAMGDPIGTAKDVGVAGLQAAGWPQQQTVLKMADNFGKQSMDGHIDIVTPGEFTIPAGIGPGGGVKVRMPGFAWAYDQIPGAQDFATWAEEHPDIVKEAYTVGWTPNETKTQVKGAVPGTYVAGSGKTIKPGKEAVLAAFYDSKGGGVSGFIRKMVFDTLTDPTMLLPAVAGGARGVQAVGRGVKAAGDVEAAVAAARAAGIAGPITQEASRTAGAVRAAGRGVEVAGSIAEQAARAPDRIGEGLGVAARGVVRGAESVPGLGRPVRWATTESAKSKQAVLEGVRRTQLALFSRSEAARDYLRGIVPGPGGPGGSGPTPLAGTGLDAPIPTGSGGGLVGKVFGAGDEVAKIGDFRVVRDGNRFAVIGPDGTAATGYFDNQDAAVAEAVRLSGLPAEGPPITQEIEEWLSGNVEPPDEVVNDIVARAGAAEAAAGYVPRVEDFVVEPSDGMPGFKRIRNTVTGDIYDYNFTGEGATAAIADLAAGIDNFGGPTSRLIPDGTEVPRGSKEFDGDGGAPGITPVAPEDDLAKQRAAFFAEKRRLHELGYTPEGATVPDLGYTPVGETNFPQPGEPPVLPTPLEPFTPTEGEAVSAYVSYYYTDPTGKSSYLNIGDAVARPEIAALKPGETERLASELDSLISKSVFPEKTTLYRGVSRPDLDRVPTDVGDIYEHDRYVSTTYDFNTAKNFGSQYAGEARTVLQFNVPEGMPGLVHPNMIHGESEVLLPRKTKWQVTGITEVDGGWNGTIRLVTLDPVAPTGAGISPPAYTIPPLSTTGQPIGIYKDGVELVVGDPVSTPYGTGKVIEKSYADEVKVVVDGSNSPHYLPIKDIKLLPTEGTTPFGRTSARPPEPGLTPSSRPRTPDPTNTPISNDGHPLVVGDKVSTFSGKKATVTGDIGNKGFGYKLQLTFDDGTVSSYYADELTSTPSAKVPPGWESSVVPPGEPPASFAAGDKVDTIEGPGAISGPYDPVLDAYPVNLENGQSPNLGAEFVSPAGTLKSLPFAKGDKVESIYGGVGEVVGVSPGYDGKGYYKVKFPSGNTDYLYSTEVSPPSQATGGPLYQQDQDFIDDIKGMEAGRPTTTPDGFGIGDEVAYSLPSGPDHVKKTYTKGTITEITEDDTYGPVATIKWENGEENQFYTEALTVTKKAESMMGGAGEVPSAPLAKGDKVVVTGGYQDFVGKEMTVVGPFKGYVEARFPGEEKTWMFLPNELSKADKAAPSPGSPFDQFVDDEDITGMPGGAGGPTAKATDLPEGTILPHPYEAGVTGKVASVKADGPMGEKTATIKWNNGEEWQVPESYTQEFEYGVPVDQYSATGPFPSKPDDAKEIKNLGGTTGGGAKQVEWSGQQFVKKTGNSPGHITAEHAADQVYGIVGANTPESRLYMTQAGTEKLARFIPDAQRLADLDDEARAAAEAKLREHFVVDALLGNWDVAGLEADNVLVDAAGNVHRIDNGGSLSYRAQGARKSDATEWNATVIELDTMRGLPDPNGNPSKVNEAAKRAFSSVTDEDIVRQIDTLITPNKDELIEYMTQSGVSVKDIRVFKERIDYLEEWANKRRAAVATGDFDALIDPDELSRRARPSPPPTDETTKWLMSFEGKKSAKTSIPSDLYGGSDGLVHVGNKIDYYGQPVTVTGITDSDTLVLRYDDGELFGLKPSAKNYDDLDAFSAMDDAGAFGDPSRAAASGSVGDTIPGESVGVPGSQPLVPSGPIPMPKTIAAIFGTPSKSGDSLMDLVRARGEQGEAEVGEFYRIYDKDAPLTYKQMADIDLETKKQTEHLTSLQDATPEQVQVWFVGGDKTRPLTPAGTAESARRKALTESYNSRFLKVKDAVDQRRAWREAGLPGEPPAYRYGWGDTSPLPPIERAADGTVISPKNVRGVFLRAPKDRPELRSMIEHAVFNPDHQVATDIRYALHAAPWEKYNNLANKLKALREEVWGPDSTRSTKSALQKYASAEEEIKANRDQGLFKLTKKEQKAAGKEPPDPGLTLGGAGVVPPGPPGPPGPPIASGGAQVPPGSLPPPSGDAAAVPSAADVDVLRQAQRQGDIGGDYDLANISKPRTFGTPSYVPKEARDSWNWSEARRKDAMTRAATTGSGRVEMSLDDVYRESPDTRVLFERPLANAETPDDRRLGDIFLDLARKKVDDGMDADAAIRQSIDEAIELVAPKRTASAFRRSLVGRLLAPVGKAYMSVSRHAKGTQMFSWTNVPRRFVGDTVGTIWGLLITGNADAIPQTFDLRSDGFARDSWRRMDESWAEGMGDSKIGRMVEEMGEVDLLPEIDVATVAGREDLDRTLARNTPTDDWFKKNVQPTLRFAGAATGFGPSEIAKRAVSTIDRTGRAALEFTQLLKRTPETRQRFFDTIADSERVGQFGSRQPINTIPSEELIARLGAVADESEFGLFSPRQVREIAHEVGYSTGQAEHLARQWRSEITKMRSAAKDEVSRVFFDYRTTKLDEVLNKGFFYHYWLSRATPLYLQTAIKNPAVMASYAHMKDNMQRECERSGEGRCGYLKMFETAGGLGGYFNPLFLLSTTLINFEQDFNNPDARMIDRVLDKVPAMLNPILQGALSAIGASSSDYVDPIASHGPRRVWSTALNKAKAEGWFGLEKSRFIDPTPEFWSKLVAASSEWLEGKALTPWAKKVIERKPGRSDGMIMNHLAIESIYARHGIEPGTDPDWTPPAVQREIEAAIAAIDTQQEETNPDAQQAFQDWQSGNWRRALGSMAFSGVGLGDPDLDAIRAMRRDEAGTPKEIAAARNTLGYVESGGPLDAALTRQEALYQKSGPPMGRYYNLMHNRIHYSPDELPSNIAAAGKIYMRDDLIAMSEDERKLVADEWLLDQGVGPGERQAYFDARDALSADPSNAEYAAYLEWSSGARDIGMDKLMKISPRYKQYIQDLPKDVRNDPARLEQFAFSEDAYQFVEGERPSVYSDQPVSDALDISQVNPVDFLKGATGATENTAKGKKDPGLQLREDLVRYHTDLALFEQNLQAFTGNPYARWQEGMNPQLESAMRWHLANAGIDIPSKPASLVNYEAWANSQRYSGKPDSVADYIEWAREAQRQLGNAGLDLDDMMALAIYGQSALSIETPTPTTPTSVYAP